MRSRHACRASASHRTRWTSLALAATSRRLAYRHAQQLADLDALGRHLLSFGRRYEQIATPFEWKFTRRDLERQLARLDDAAGEPVAAKAA